MQDWFRTALDTDAHAPLTDVDRETLCRRRINRAWSGQAPDPVDICPVCARLLRGREEVRYAGPRTPWGVGAQ